MWDSIYDVGQLPPRVGDVNRERVAIRFVTFDCHIPGLAVRPDDRGIILMPLQRVVDVIVVSGSHVFALQLLGGPRMRPLGKAYHIIIYCLLSMGYGHTSGISHGL